MHWRSLRRCQGCYWQAGLQTTTGQEGERRGGGKYNQECLFDDDGEDNKYNDAEDGKGLRGGADDGGNLSTLVAMSSTGHPSRAWGRGRQLSAPTVPLLSSMRTFAAMVGEHCAPPCPVRPVPPDTAHHCQCCQPWLVAASQGSLGRDCMRGGGGGSPHCCIQLSGYNLTRGG